jgi:hypothetical protein
MLANFTGYVNQVSILLSRNTIEYIAESLPQSRRFRILTAGWTVLGVAVLPNLIKVESLTKLRQDSCNIAAIQNC